MSHIYTYQVEDSTHILDDFEAVGIIAMEYVRSHECKYRHNIMKHRVGGESGKIRHQQKCLIEGLRVVGDYP